MAKDWRMVRLPVELVEKLERLGQEMLQNHIEGRAFHPVSDRHDRETLPLHYVISVCVGDKEAHRKRSRSR